VKKVWKEREREREREREIVKFFEKINNKWLMTGSDKERDSSFSGTRRRRSALMLLLLLGQIQLRKMSYCT